MTVVKVHQLAGRNPPDGRSDWSQSLLARNPRCQPATRKSGQRTIREMGTTTPSSLALNLSPRQPSCRPAWSVIKNHWVTSDSSDAFSAVSKPGASVVSSWNERQLSPHCLNRTTAEVSLRTWTANDRSVGSSGPPKRSTAPRVAKPTSARKVRTTARRCRLRTPIPRDTSSPF